jgi:trans-aconitate methyltransferase
MKPKKQAAHYDKIAYHWDSEKFNRNNGIKQHERALRLLDDAKTAIDIGCGSSGRFIDVLLEKGLTVEGLDLSTEMLNLAKRRHPDILFHHADICTWDFPKQYDFISAWDSIWHAPLDQQADVLRKLCNGLNSGGVLIYTTGNVDKPGEVCNDCLGQPLYHAALGIREALRIIDESDCICRHLENDDWPDLHLYLIIQKIKK